MTTAKAEVGDVGGPTRALGRLEDTPRSEARPLAELPSVDHAQQG